MKGHNGKIVATIVALLAMAAPSHAYVIDGLLNDWGVTIGSNWTPASPTAQYVQHDGLPGTNGIFTGGEQYDAEAMYFDSDANNLYFAVVTRFPNTGVVYNSETIVPGDLALHINGGNSQTLTGTRPGDQHSVTFDYDYGVKTTGPNAGGLYQDPTWAEPNSYVGHIDN